MSVLFLDIDGVINTNKNYDWGPGPVPMIDFNLVSRVNKIVHVTQAQIVLTSSWRYQVLNNNMTLKGFQFLLRTHGMRGDLIDVTPCDHDCPIRGRQIAQWIESHKPKYYAILDDDTCEHLDAIHGNRVVFADKSYGLLEEQVAKVIEILGREVTDDEFNSMVRKYRECNLTAVHD